MSQYPQGPLSFDQSQPLGYESNTASRAITSFFNAVYAWMAVGLAVTAAVAFFVSTQPALWQLTHNLIALIVMVVVEIGLVVAISGAIQRLSTAVATGLFLLFAAVNGVVLSTLLLVYAPQAIAVSFVVTSGMFAATSIYGYVTKTDLTRFRGMLFMGLIGIVLASLVNLFFMSPILYWLITYAGVFVFIGLTAYDTQKLKMIAMQTQDNPAMAARLSVVGSLTLYLDFINLFIFMLRILGNRRQ